MVSMTAVVSSTRSSSELYAPSCAYQEFESVIFLRDFAHLRVVTLKIFILNDSRFRAIIIFIVVFSQTVDKFQECRLLRFPP
jgi:hypothetical protein